MRPDQPLSTDSSHRPFWKRNFSQSYFKIDREIFIDIQLILCSSFSSQKRAAGEKPEFPQRRSIFRPLLEFTLGGVLPFP
jgi:hypothetical protein